jgi:hypothetical protein
LSQGVLGQLRKWTPDRIDISLATAISEQEKLKLTAFNPAYAIVSFSSAVENGRLEAVELLYKEVGYVQWEYAKAHVDDTFVKIDFSSVEDNNYGYTKVDWDYSLLSLPDGAYELKVETVCTTANCPLDFNRVSDSPLLL